MSWQKTVLAATESDLTQALYLRPIAMLFAVVNLELTGPLLCLARSDEEICLSHPPPV